MIDRTGSAGRDHELLGPLQTGFLEVFRAPLQPTREELAIKYQGGVGLYQSRIDRTGSAGRVDWYGYPLTIERYSTELRA